MFGKPPCKKHLVLAGLAAVALLLGIAGTAVRTDTAQAKPTGVLTFSPNVCIALMRVIEGDCNADDAYTAGECDADCAAGLGTADGLNDVARALGADVSATVGAAPESDLGTCGDGVDDDVDTVVDDGCATGFNDPALFQDLADLGGAQLGDYSVAAATQGKLWVLTFVSNDGPLTLEADEGIWLSNGVSNTNCSAILDEDCNNDGVKGDGIVVDRLLGNGVADLGDAELVATQSGVDVIYDYVVVGEPQGIALALVPDGTVQEGVTKSQCADDPHLTPLDSSVFRDGVDEPEKNGLTATVTDDDGTALAGIYVDWSSDDSDVASLNLPKTVTWALDSGTLALNLFCGDEIGTATITADIGVKNAAVNVSVIGAPDAMTLTASPAAMVCDGVNSSTVAAYLVDSMGNPVVDGTPVRFNVTCLGVSDPITARTTDGTATSHITPLSGVSAGVVVLVSVRDADGNVLLEGNIRIDCVVAPPPPPPALTGDVNCSDTVTMVDAMLVAQYVVGLIPEFPCNVSPPPLPTP
jgi:hypothetical protein